MNARLTVKLRRQQPKIQLLGCGLDAIIQRGDGAVSDQDRIKRYESACGVDLLLGNRPFQIRASVYGARRMIGEALQRAWREGRRPKIQPGRPRSIEAAL